MGILQVLLPILSLAAILGFGCMVWLRWSQGSKVSMKFAKWFAPVWCIQLLGSSLYLYFLLRS